MGSGVVVGELPRTNMSYYAKYIGEESACDYATRCNEDPDGTESL